MKILAIEKPCGDTRADAFQPHLKSEALKVWEFSQAGIIREAYFRQDHASAVLILECRNVAEAHEILACLPLVREGLIAFDLIPLRAYSGFARLFAG